MLKRNYQLGRGKFFFKKKNRDACFIIEKNSPVWFIETLHHHDDGAR
jgi:hypothetical protein